MIASFRWKCLGPILISVKYEIGVFLFVQKKNEQKTYGSCICVWMFRHNFNSSAAIKLHLFDILFVVFAQRRQPESEHILIWRIRDLFIYAEWLAVDEMATQNIFGKAKCRTKKNNKRCLWFFHPKRYLKIGCFLCTKLCILIFEIQCRKPRAV